MSSTKNVLDQIKKAAKAIHQAEALLFTAGAGMGVDSGLPDFRGKEGFWRAYPPMKHLGLQFENMSTPSWFSKDPEFAWGFWAHRFELYKNAKPHEGYYVLKRLGERVKDNYFIFTSNVDGAFERVFPEKKIMECHGQVFYMQCTDTDCNSESGIWRVDSLNVEFDKTSFRAQKPLPQCKKCKSIARPNVLMFYDFSWDPERYYQQQKQMTQWLKGVDGKKVVVIEIGAGEYVPTVRRTSEDIAEETGGVLVRINPRDYQVPSGNHIGIPMGGKDALVQIEQELLKLG